MKPNTRRCLKNILIIPLAMLVTASFSQAETKPPATSVKALTDRDVYYPGTEDLKPDEMRVVACGTGMPNARPKQAAACFLVELGNGDKFIFDIGTGSSERISALKIPYDYLDKVFIGHLHADHFGDLDALWVGGVLANRQKPLRVWGPSGHKKEYGTAYAVEHMEKMFAWDYASRQGNVNTVGFKIEVNEFDYKKVNNEIYNENGVKIRTIPAIHALDGPVSFILEWNGLKFAFSSDTYPNKWWIKESQGADIAIHECFITPWDLVNKQKFPVADALNVSTQVHTSPAQFGKVMSQTNPRLAVAYHFFNDFDTLPGVMSQVQKTYNGRVAYSTDYMVFNVTKDDIKVRMAVTDEDIWPEPSLTDKLPADPADRVGFTDYINSGRVVYTDVVKGVYDDTNKEFGTDYQPPK
ncbi:guanitoxin biosynthesis MBL fold metallo-hydrolase GntH [Sulfurovum sp. CS9]|uniref:guanitoxin biosynthesis MBL fold metallo-hydrolase GntH n=1 Tax=Sulfurovum sp. CS9 TaxID=3391146 RepID=UPI0039ECCEFA